MPSAKGEGPPAVGQMKTCIKPFETTTASTSAPIPKTVGSRLISQREVAAFCDRWLTSAWYLVPL